MRCPVTTPAPLEETAVKLRSVSSFVRRSFALALVSSFAVLGVACAGDEESELPIVVPPPEPTAAAEAPLEPQPSAVASGPAVLTAAPKKAAAPADPTGLKQCCVALHKNAS